MHHASAQAIPQFNTVQASPAEAVTVIPADKIEAGVRLNKEDYILSGLHDQSRSRLPGQADVLAVGCV